MTTTFQISINATPEIFEQHFNENNTEKSPNFKVYDILVGRTKEPNKSAYELNYDNLNPQEIILKYPDGGVINIDNEIKRNIGKFLKEPKLYENEGIDCFLYFMYLKGLFDENDITEIGDKFIFGGKIQELNPNFEKLKIKKLKELETRLKIGDGILTGKVWKKNIHVSMYIGNGLFLGKLGNFPPYIYKLSELNNIPGMKFNPKTEIYKIKF